MNEETTEVLRQLLADLQATLSGRLDTLASRIDSVDTTLAEVRSGQRGLADGVRALDTRMHGVEARVGGLELDRVRNYRVFQERPRANVQPQQAVRLEGTALFPHDLPGVVPAWTVPGE